MYPFTCNRTGLSYYYLDDLRKRIGDHEACTLWAREIAKGTALKINGRDAVRSTVYSE